MPHFDAAYRLARWLTKDESRADDVVQEAYLRAFSFFDSLRSADSRPWLLSIVRNTCYTLLRKERTLDCSAEYDEALHEAPPERSNPEVLRVRTENQELLQRALAELPEEYSEFLVLREL
jgi:RNA polymerase sigma factor (sigma-70 family)